MSERYVLLGLAPARAPWFRCVAQWCHEGSVPAELVKCLSPEEMRARLGGARPHSAVVVDAAAHGLDRDLIDAARVAGCAVLVVTDTARGVDWIALGADAQLPTDLDRRALLGALGDHAVAISDHRAFDATPDEQIDRAASPVVAVCGAGGSGSSTVACALAQDLAHRGWRPLLADLARDADQAMLHDAGDAGRGIQELVEAHRSGTPSANDVLGHTHFVPDRGYHLLTGLRRSRSWSAIRPRAFAAALESLRDCFDLVVCDTDADLESERDGGSADVEDRNVMARTSVLAASVVVAVGSPGLKGVHALLRVLAELRRASVDPERVLVVINRGPRSARARASLSEALAALVPPDGLQARAAPIFLPERPVEASFIDGSPLPAPLPDLIGGAVAVQLVRVPEPGDDAEPERIMAGSLGSWTLQAAG